MVLIKTIISLILFNQRLTNKKLELTNNETLVLWIISCEIVDLALREVDITICIHSTERK